MSPTKIALCFTLLWANICWAEPCESDTLQKLGSHIGYQPAATTISDCKIMPNKPQYMLVAIAQLTPESIVDEGNYAGEYDLDMIVMDAASYKVIKRFSQAKAIPTDAIAFTGLTIDTAKYNLNNRQRAFGLRVNFRGSSRVNPYSQTLLNLYIEVDKGLQEVLHGFEVESYSGEWDGNCEGEFYFSTSTLAIKKTEATGFSDLLVKTQSGGSVNRLIKDECTDKEKVKETQHSLLRYTGGSYKLVTEKTP